MRAGGMLSQSVIENWEKEGIYEFADKEDGLFKLKWSFYQDAMQNIAYKSAERLLLESFKPVLK